MEYQNSIKHLISRVSSKSVQRPIAMSESWVGYNIENCLKWLGNLQFIIA